MTLGQFIICPQYTIFTCMSPYLPIFNLIWSYLHLIALILPYVSYSPYITLYSAIETAHMS